MGTCLRPKAEFDHSIDRALDGSKISSVSERHILGCSLIILFFSLSLFIPSVPLVFAAQPPVEEEDYDVPEGHVFPWTSWAIGAVVKALALDSETLWVGTSQGLIKFNIQTEQQITFTRANGLRSDSILALSFDKQKNLWLGTNGGGMLKYDGKKWVSYDKGSGLVDEYVWSILFDPDGTQWIGTWYGVNKVSRSKWDTYTIKDGVANEWVYVILSDRNGSKWFGTEGGVNRFDGRQWQTWTHKDGLGADQALIEKELGHKVTILPSGQRHQGHKIQEGVYNPDYVVCGLIDKQDNKWFGTWGGGLSRFDGKFWKTYTMSDGLAGNTVHAIAMDQRGIFWIGTNKGVSRFDGKNFKNFGVRDGLFAIPVYSITIGPDGSKWFGSFGGISRYTGE